MDGLYTKIWHKYMKSSLGVLEHSVGIPTPDASSPIVPDPEAELTLVAWGDPQISSLSPLRSARLSAACRDIANINGKIDALMLLGDITEYGRECEYRMAADIIGTVSDKFDTFLCVSGNHDVRFRDYSRQLKKFENFVSKIKGGLISGNGHYYFSVHIKGYKFIMMGTDSNTLEDAYISDEQLKNLEDDLDEVKDGKPVFILNHQTLKGDNGLPITWLGKGDWRGSVGDQSDKIKEIFDRHKNIVYITGHLHYGVSRYNFEDHGSYKALSVPTVGVMNHGEYDKDSQGYVLSVYKDRIIGRARSFGEGKYVDSSIEGAEFEIKLEK
ncbi:MAG: metallophosphoesterase [Clostridia bacterium]|nr:metallophosphoesterase [Clostridia bacterium]